MLSVYIVGGSNVEGRMGDPLRCIKSTETAASPHNSVLLFERLSSNFVRSCCFNENILGIANLLAAKCRLDLYSNPSSHSLYKLKLGSKIKADYIIALCVGQSHH